MQLKRLVLSRRVGEPLMIGTKHVTVTHIGSRLVTIRIRAGDQVVLRAGGDELPFDLGNGASIALADVQGSQCKLRMLAPETIHIVRTDLLK